MPLSIQIKFYTADEVDNSANHSQNYLLNIGDVSASESANKYDNSSNVDKDVEREWGKSVSKFKYSSMRVARADEMETSEKKRVIFLNDDARNAKYPYPSNYIKTTKYTILTFLPVSLFIQFLRVANIYFLIIAILQSIPAISPLSPYTAILPLTFVLGVSMIREGIEDFRRYRSDKRINMMKFNKLISKGQFEEIESKDIKVGDILLVKEDDTFPADLVLLKSSLGQNAFIQTSSLDGEKNLKKRTIPVNFDEYVKPREEMDFHLVGK
jgi:magnesium-transporting ATPase (P-type)